jgi:hypothetical protein
VREARLDPQALADGVAALLADEPARNAMRVQGARLGLRNGVDIAMEAIERLLQRADTHTEVAA